MRRPQGEADGHLAAAGRGPGQEQVGDVGAGDQQQQADGGGDQAAGERGAVAHARRQRRLHHRDGGEAEVLVDARELPLQVAGHPAQERLRPLQAGAGREAAHDGEDEGPPALHALGLGPSHQLAVHGERHPEIGRRVQHAQALELRPGDAHHGEGLAAEAHLPAQHAGIGGEAALPEVVGEHHHRVGAGGRLLVGPEEAAPGRLHPQHVEVARGDDLALELRRVPLAPQGGGDVAVGGEAGEGLARLPPQVLEVRVGERQHVALGQVDGVERHQPLRVRHRQALEEERVEEREDERVRPDAESQGCDRRDGERRAPAQRAHGVT
ncbi:MAG TPA: hypothetical protein VG477_06905 [Thermoanaerobaculia bacterium]|nr:hypothetical protein [Thermoanaerobaculia bacterium]